MSEVARRIEEVQDRIARAAARAGRDPGAVELVAVAKTAGEEDLRAAWDAGQRSFAHNRVQALEAHHAVLPEADWHLVGPMQGNKVRRALRCASLVQTVGEAKTAARMQRILAEEERDPFPVLVQVNPHPEDGRYGCAPESLDELVERVSACDRLRLRGLMAIGLQDAEESRLRADFARLRAEFERLLAGGALHSPAVLSLGMTEDYEIAVEEGATLVRVGRALFPSPPSAD